MNFPLDKKYQIIYADPPWSYKDKALAGNRGANCKYPTQSDDWISQLPVKDIADENCALFLWVTMPKLDIAFDVIKSWGFTYKTAAFTWIKKNKKSDSLFWGMGNFTRANSEICLFALKGKLKRQSAKVHSVIMSPIEEHSKKPDETKDRIVSLLGDLPRIELFARQQTKGWTAWGNEVKPLSNQEENNLNWF